MAEGELTPFPLGYGEKNYNSIKSRAGITNLQAEVDQDGQYSTVRDTFGLTLFADTNGESGRSNLFVNANYMYFVCGEFALRVDEFGTVEELGDVGGSGRALIFSNGVPGDNQIMILNGAGLGYVYTDGDGLELVDDPDFLATLHGDMLDERGFFAVRDTNEWFASDVSELRLYDPEVFGSAEQNPDNMVGIIVLNSAAWLINERSIEYWQGTTDEVQPIRVVKGATKNRGCSAVGSIAKAGERFAFFADDNTVRAIEGSQMVTISDLEFELRVRGDGTDEFPGFSVTDDAIGFFIDGPVHKQYYLTFPTEQFTWSYDFGTGQSHLRSSEDLGYWRIGAATLFNNKLYGLDLDNGRLYELDQGAKDENGDIMRRTMTLPSISYPVDWTLPYIEVVMEVGQTSDPTADPKMMVEYSKDGGYTYTTWGTISLGKFGNHKQRVALRRFGRIVRHKDFILRFIVTDAVRVQFYSVSGQVNPDG